ncbi:hypothetical protein L6452_31879 [Arctium lappa]|uniref:Uncharacterized protein n=1 Tax=Arctium lappa TaxID=4217 RepID=A0ACB8Z456_ARCLA|nr:hypothetical protein L6452_31879 [Arctium lappa]
MLLRTDCSYGSVYILQEYDLLACSLRRGSSNHHLVLGWFHGVAEPGLDCGQTYHQECISETLVLYENCQPEIEDQASIFGSTGTDLCQVRGSSILKNTKRVLVCYDMLRERYHPLKHVSKHKANLLAMLLLGLAVFFVFRDPSLKTQHKASDGDGVWGRGGDRLRWSVGEGRRPIEMQCRGGEEIDGDAV